MLGAAMFMVEIAGMRVLYTGDYSRQPDRHLSAADLPDVRPDIGAPVAYDGRGNERVQLLDAAG